MIGILENLSNFAIYLIQNLGYWGVFIGMIIESACIPLPSEIIMTFSGYVVWQGNTNMTIFGITIIGSFANLLGSLIAYYLGLIGGRPILEKYGKYILITNNSLERADRWFDKYGYEAVFISRMLPGIRTFISFPAGIAHMDIKKFIIYTFIGSLPWTFALGYIGFSLGPHWELIESYFHILDIIVLIGVIGLIVYYINKYKYKNV
ncbi:MAG: DedA family protein [Methanobacterium sp.]|nr:DedA family protein [Methanobacterium sp.]